MRQTMQRPYFVAVMAVVLMVVVATVAQAVETDVHDGIVSGRVVQTLSNGQVVGAPGMQVKLIPPTSTKRTPLISLTNSRGEYSFARQPPGSYLFEVYRGPVLLYRRVLDTSRDSKFTVA